MTTATLAPRSDTPSDDSRSELMFLGKECHHADCHLHDFLPFTCPACKLSFCQPHFLPSQHKCSAPLPVSMVDRIAPTCPLCHQVVPTARSGDPNEAVDRHILDGICVGLPGGEEKRKEEIKRKKERGEICWKKGCGKGLIVQMKCESCHHSFCPPHRHSTSHNCTPVTSRTSTPGPGPGFPARSQYTSTSASTKPVSSASRLVTNSQTQPKSSTPSENPQSSSKPLDVRAAAAAAAMKRAGGKVSAATPFVKTKTEKRADQEAASQLQALKARHDKGLLSKAEELRYAELIGKKESGRRKGEKGDKDCVIC